MQEPSIKAMVHHSPMIGPDEMEARVVRYADLRPCLNAFVDTRTPGSEAKENFTIIGPGVSENPAQHVHIAEPHGFNIGGARQPVGCVNSQHSHDSAEVFVVHSGHWRFDLGEHGDAAQVHLAPGDTISLPTRMFRGFTATSPADDGAPGFLWAVLGGDDPGRVTWAPRVFEMARDYGLVLLDNGSLIDTAAGGRAPEGVAPMRPTTREQADALAVPSQAAAERLVVRCAAGPAEDALRIVPVIGPGAPLDWPHGFTLDRLAFAPGAALDGVALTPTVVFLHAGALRLEWDGGTLALDPGDTVTLPLGFAHRLVVDTGACAFRVTGMPA